MKSLHCLWKWSKQQSINCKLCSQMFLGYCYLSYFLMKVDVKYWGSFGKNKRNCKDFLKYLSSSISHRNGQRGEAFISAFLFFRWLKWFLGNLHYDFTHCFAASFIGIAFRWWCCAFWFWFSWRPKLQKKLGSGSRVV